MVLLKQLQPYLSDINLDVGKIKEGEGLHKFLNNVNVQRQSIHPDTQERTHKKAENISLDRSALLPGIKCYSYFLAISLQKGEEDEPVKKLGLLKTKLKKPVTHASRTVDRRFK